MKKSLWDTQQQKVISASRATSVPRVYHGEDSRPLVKVGTGEYYASESGELLTTTVGSCIAACVLNPKSGVGGMNHFLLPGSMEDQSTWEKTIVNAPARYGGSAMERLINLVAGYSPRRQLIVKVFGGAKVLQARIDIGQRNCDFIQDYLRKESMDVSAMDLGGTLPRKLVFDTRSGDVFVKFLGRDSSSRIARTELEHFKAVQNQPVGGDIELFGVRSSDQ